MTGFTLLELLIVLSVAAMLVSLSGPLYSRVVPGARTKSDVHALIVALRDAASDAVSSGHESRVRFSIPERSYAAGGSRPVTLSGGTRLSVESALELHGPPSDDYGTATIRFFPDGSSSGGTISLSGANRDYLIGVDWLTGRVELLENAK